MKNKHLHPKRAFCSALFVLLLNVVEMTKLQAQDITFADVNVKALCVANWDTDNDGELSYAEAAAVTNLGEVFKNKSNITSFDELQYFTGLTSIGNYAFYYCRNLTTMIIPNTVTTIGNFAFQSCSGLTTIVIPNSVTSIGLYAFSGCRGLTSIDIPNSVASIQGGAFSNCTGLTSIVIPNSVTSIKYRAFEYCTSLTSINIPNSVTSIEQFAFLKCTSLTSIIIPNSVISIGANPFSGCGLEQMVVDFGNTVYDSRNDCNAIIESSTNELISGCKNTIIPNSMTSIGDFAFYYCSWLTSIDIPNSVTSIGYDAFSGCSGLTSITIPNSVTSIGYQAFSSCIGLTSIYIPSSVTYIESSAFASCSALEQIVVELGNEVYDSRGNCNAIIETSTNKLIAGCINTVIPNSVISIESDAFNSCTGLTSIDIPNSVVSIGSNAFNSCTNLTSVSIGNSLTTIGDLAFFDCTSLTSIIIPSSMTSIGDWAFFGCTHLTSITVYAETPPSLGSLVFNNVNNSIPVYVPCASIEVYHEAEGWNDFTNCLGMCPGVITVSANPDNYGTVSGSGFYEGGETCTVTATPEEGYSFAYWSENDLLVSLDESYSFLVAGNRKLVANFTQDGIIDFVDANVKALCVANWDINGDGELSYVEAAAVMSLGEVFSYHLNLTSFDELQYFTGLTSIGYSAFCGCSSLTTIAIPNSVTSIEAIAFCLCNNLTSIDIPNSVISIGSGAFYDCYHLTTITIPSSVTSIGINPFYGCSSMAQIIVDSGNTVYDSRNNCNAIIKTSTNELVTGCKNTIIPDAVTFIGNEAFSWCSGLTSIDIPNSVTSIGNEAFYYCWNLTSMSIGNTVTSIGNSAFYFCSNLTSLTVYAELPPSLGSYAFYNINKSIPVYVPNGCVSAYQAASGWNEFTNILELGLVPISFADTIVKAICVANWDTNGDGELNITEAAAVTSLENVFYNNSSISTFNELRYFTGLTSIEDYAFQNCTSLTSVEIPNTVISIGLGAFSYCSGLTSIEIPNTVTSIGSNAFYNCSGLTSIEIPNSVTFITNNPFTGCFGLEQIFVEASNTVYDSRGNCNAVINSSTNELLIGCKNTVIPKSVTQIGKKAFFDCSSLTSIEIPKSVTYIGLEAFNSCSGLTSMIVWADNPPILEYPGMEEGDLKWGFLEGDGDVFGGVDKSIPVYVPIGSLNAYQTASGWSEFTNIQELGPLPISFADANVKALCVANWDTNGDGELSYAEAAAVTNLGEVFRGNAIISSFDELQYFMSLTSIGFFEFTACTGLTSIEIPNSINFIGEYAFYNCSGLTSIEIPGSVTFIGKYAFERCISLTSIEIPNSVTSIGNAAFRGCSCLISIEIPNSVTSIRDYMFSECNSLTSIEIPSSVTSIGTAAFRGCSGLISIEIPNSVTSIGSNAFSSCIGLEQIMVDSGNTVYDSRDNCNAIIKTNTNELVVGCKNTVIPNSVTSIGSSAFSGCSGLTSVDIPNSVTSIGSSTFYNCTDLTAIELPNSVTSIGSSAFYNCIGLTSITLWTDNPPTLSYDIFIGVNKTIPIYVPCNAEESYRNAYGWSEFTRIIGMCSGEITVTVNPSEGGTVTGAGYYNGGDLCVLTATPNPGFSFGNWVENGVVVSTDTVFSFRAHSTNIVANFCSHSPIVFADAHVKALCVANWDTDGDGELSYVEAAAVTSLGEVFRFKPTILSFDELQYFIGLTSIEDLAFYYCTGLTSVEIPNTVSEIGNSAFGMCLGLTSITVWADNPPVLGDGGCEPDDGELKVGGGPGGPFIIGMAFENVDKTIPVYVPCNTAEAYQNAEGWNEFTNFIEMCEVSQTCNLSQGWNWFSTKLDITLNDLKSSLVAALPGTNITIKSKNNGTSTYNGTTWRGQLTTLDVTQMYRISVSTACEITIEGMPINPAEHPVTIVNGANWIAFPFGESMTVNEAFAGFAVSGDVVKSKENGIATYNGTQWRGTLNTLVPGQGYIYKSNVNEDRFFTFPIGTK